MKKGACNTKKKSPNIYQLDKQNPPLGICYLGLKCFDDAHNHLTAAYFTQKDYKGPSLTSLDSAKGIKVAANLGYSLSRILTQSGIEHTTVRDEISGIRLMLKGRVDAYLAYTRPVFWNQASFGNRLQDERIRFHQVKNFPYYLIVSKKHENAQELIHAFNQSIRDMTKTGRLSEIMDSYLEKFIVMN